MNKLQNNNNVEAIKQPKKLRLKNTITDQIKSKVRLLVFALLPACTIQPGINTQANLQETPAHTESGEQSESVNYKAVESILEMHTSVLDTFTQMNTVQKEQLTKYKTNLEKDSDIIGYTSYFQELINNAPDLEQVISISENAISNLKDILSEQQSTQTIDSEMFEEITAQSASDIKKIENILTKPEVARYKFLTRNYNYLVSPIHAENYAGLTMLTGAMLNDSGKFLNNLDTSGEGAKLLTKLKNTDYTKATVAEMQDTIDKFNGFLNQVDEYYNELVGEPEDEF